jgi:predicted DNA-binding transcriptional regulator YafY
MIKITSPEQAFKAIVKAAKRHHPVTIAYRRADGSETLRTIEVYEITRNKAGDRYAKAMTRQGEQRSFRLDRIAFLQVHRTAYLVPVPEPKSVQRPVVRPAAEILREMHNTGRSTVPAEVAA